MSIKSAKLEGSLLHLTVEVGSLTPSSTGKMLMCVNSGGYKDTGILVEGKPLRVTVMGGINNK